jgi:hypothetical protein
LFNLSGKYCSRGIFAETSRASAARVSSLWSRNLRQSRVFGLTVLRFSSKRQQLIVTAGLGVPVVLLMTMVSNGGVGFYLT